jgi:hypothetical protein
MTLEEELRAAGEARGILDSRIFQAAKHDVEEKLATVRRNVPIRDTEMHTRLILMEQLWANLLGYFEQIAQTGKMAALQLEEQRKKASLLEQGIAMFRNSGRNTL